MRFWVKGVVLDFGATTHILFSGVKDATVEAIQPPPYGLESLRQAHVSSPQLCFK